MAGATVLDGLLDPLSRCFDAESARRLVAFRIPEAVQARVNLLAERANQGTLTEEERTKYEALINAADLISVLKLKAGQQIDLPENPAVSKADSTKGKRLPRTHKLRLADLPLEGLEVLPTLEELERMAIAEAIRRCKGDKNKAAVQLGLTREGLRRKLLRAG